MKKQQKPIVSVIGCLIVMVCIGIIYLWSVLKNASMEYYGWTLSAANLVASFMMFAFCVGNFVGGALNDRFGPKNISIIGVAMFGVGIFLASCLPSGSSVVLFYLTYSVIGGLGVGIAYGAILSCIQKWFPHKRGFATGLATAAFGLSTVVFSQVIGGLLDTMAVNAMLRLLSIVFLVVGIISCLLIRLPNEEYLAALPKPTPKKSTITTRRDLPLKEAIKTLPFWCLLLNIFFYNGTWNMLNPLIRGLGEARGLAPSVAVLCVTLTGLFNAAGRFTMSSLSDKIGRTTTVIILSVVTIVCALLLTFVGGGVYLVVVLVTAFAFGGPSAVNPATSTDLFGAKYGGANYGVIMLALGVSSLFFNAISNAMYEATQAYTLTFIMGAVTALITIVLMLIINRTLKKQQSEEG